MTAKTERIVIEFGAEYTRYRAGESSLDVPVSGGACYLYLDGITLFYRIATYEDGMTHRICLYCSRDNLVAIVRAGSAAYDLVKASGRVATLSVYEGVDE